MIYADHMFLSAALQMGRIDESAIAELLAAEPSIQPEQLVKTLLERGVIQAADRNQFIAGLRAELDSSPGDPEVMLRALAERSARRVVPLLKLEAVQAFFKGSPGAEGKKTTAIVEYFDESFLGAGGLGQVWRAIDAQFNREVAVKRILPGVNLRPEARQAFLREAQITAQLQHPNIVPVYSLGAAETDGGAAYAMRLIHGKTLGEVISSVHRSRNGRALLRSDLSFLLQVFLRAADAVSYANSRGIIHRDLKPSNIICGEFGETVVVDWGLAKLLSDPTIEANSKLELTESVQAIATESGGMIGSPLYMAPEQAVGANGALSVRTDVFGLGGILYALLSGRPPNKPDGPESMDQLLARVVSGKIPRLREIEPKTPAILDAICAKALATDPLDRYATAAELADDVRRCVAGEPISIHREPWRRRSIRWLANSAFAQFSIISLIVFIVGLMVFAMTIWGEISIVLMMRQQAMKSSIDSFEFHLKSDTARMRKDVRVIASSESAADALRGRLRGDEQAAKENLQRYSRQIGKLMQIFPQYFAAEFVALEPQPTSLLRMRLTKGETNASADMTEKAPSAATKALIDKARLLAETGTFIKDESLQGAADGRNLAFGGVTALTIDGRQLGVLILSLDLSFEIQPFFPEHIFNTRLVMLDRHQHAIHDSNPNGGDSIEWLKAAVPSSVERLASGEADVSEFMFIRPRLQWLPDNVAYIRKCVIATGDEPLEFGCVAVASPHTHSLSDRWAHYGIFFAIIGACFVLIAILIVAARAMLQVIRGL